MEYTQKMKLIFLPAILMAVCLFGSGMLFHLAQDVLLISKIQNAASIFTLTKLVVFPKIILVLALLVFSGCKSFEKVFKGTLFASMGIIVFLLILAFLQETLQLNGATLKNFLPSYSVQTFEPIIKNWPSSLLIIALNLFNFNLFSLLIWGFINRFTSVSEGIKYYIPLGLILGLGGVLVGNLANSMPLFIKVSSWSLVALILPAIVLMIAATIIFNRCLKQIPDHFSDSVESGIEQKKNRFPFLTSAYLLAGSVMVEHLLNIFFKFQVKMQISDLNSYSYFMASYSSSLGKSRIIISILWATFGTWLILKRGWRATALVGSISVLVGGVVFFGFSYANQSVSGINQGVMVGLLKGTATFLFFPLIQIIYLYMPEQVRFRTKVLMEMALLPLMKGIPSIAVPSLLVVFGSMSAVIVYGEIFIFILLILLVAASIIIGRKHKKFSNV